MQWLHGANMIVILRKTKDKEVWRSMIAIAARHDTTLIWMIYHAMLLSG